MNEPLDRESWWEFEIVETSGSSAIDFWDGKDFPLG